MNLSNFTIVVRESNSPDAESVRDFVTVEVIKDVVLSARESRMVVQATLLPTMRLTYLSPQIPLSVKSARPAKLVITHIQYEFLSTLFSTETLAPPERKPERQIALPCVEIEEARHRMLADFVDDSRLVLAEGEVKELKIWLSNAGTSNIRELWVVAGADDDVWVDIDGSTRSQCSEFFPPVLFLDTNIFPSYL